MNKFLSICLACVCLIQDGFASANTVIHQDCSPIERSSSLRGLTSFVRDPSTIREGSLKRSRENFASISPSDRRTPTKRDVSIPRAAGTSFEFTDTHKDALRRCGISDLQIDSIELLQTIFFRSPHGDRFNPRSYLSESELEVIYAKIDSEEVRSLVFTLKSLYDKKIPLSEMSPNTIFTPAARLSCTDPNGPKAKEISNILAACEDIHVAPVTGHTFIEDETPETPEERSARHALKAQLFKTLEENRGISDASRLSELSAAEQIWSNYFEYMRLRVNTLDQKAGSPKITCAEIEDIFKELVGLTYSSTKVGDCIVCFRKEEIDLKRLTLNEKTNELLLSEGSAPIGADGKSMNLHHLTRRQPGIFVLLTETFHQKYTTLLHLRSKEHMRQPQQAVDRAAFAALKQIIFPTILKELVPTTEEFDPAVRLFSETDLQPQDEGTM